MAYIEDFLTNNCYKFISILLGFAFVFFTGIFDNSERYYYLTPDQNINNSTNNYNDDDDMFYNNTNEPIDPTIIVYDNSTIYRCEKILNSMHYYRIINGFIYTTLFICMGCFNFKILEYRKYFCKLFVGGTIINLFLGGINLIAEGVFKCYHIINEQYQYMQAIIVFNYLIMILILVVFAETYRKDRKNRQQEFNNNTNNQNNENTNIFLIPAYLPKYSEIKNDKPPSYQENYVINISQ